MSVDLKRRAVFDLVMLGIIGVFFAYALGFEGRAKVLPLIIATPTLLLCVGTVFGDVSRLLKSRGAAPRAAERKLDGEVTGLSELKETLWVFALIGLILLTGFLVAVPVYILVYLRFRAGQSWKLSVGLPLAYLVVMYFLFIRILNVQLYEGYLFSLLG